MLKPLGLDRLAEVDEMELMRFCYELKGRANVPFLFTQMSLNTSEVARSPSDRYKQAFNITLSVLLPLLYLLLFS